MAVIIFKAVEKCNSNCIYCDVIKKHQEHTMTFDVLELVFKRINEYLVNNPRETIDFTWHGGEVCMLGTNYFKKALEIIEDCCPETKSRINHLVQSNLTLINQEMIDVFKKMGINQIGSSFDPIPHIRGFGKNRNSDAYNRGFIRGINLLNKNKMTWGVIYVVHRKSLSMPLEIFYYLTNLNLRSHPNFNQAYIYHEDKYNLNITPEEFADFLGAIFPVWWKHRDRYPDVQPFSGIKKNVIDKDLSLVCEKSGQCSFRWIYIGPEGKTSQCGRAGDFNSLDLLNYGDIKDFTLEEILNNDERMQFNKRQQYLLDSDCSDCRFWGICHGGCPLDAYLSYNTFMKRSPNCASLKIFLEKYFEPITGYKANFRPNIVSIN